MNKRECAKCKELTEHGTGRAEGGSEFFFCRTCSEILENHQMSVMTFLGTKRFEDWNNWVFRNMRKAREARASDKSPWKKEEKAS